MTYPLLEHGPKDLLKAYNNALDDYSTNADIANWDFENSSFKEISKEEALEMAKRKEANKLHLVVDGKIVTLTPDGKATWQDFSDFQVSPDKVYTKRNGDQIQFTRLMPGSHLIKVADKIYLPTIVNKDRDLMKARDKYNKEIDDTINYVSTNTTYQFPRGTDRRNSELSHVPTHELIGSMNTKKEVINRYRAIISALEDDIETLDERIKKAQHDIEIAKKYNDDESLKYAALKYAEANLKSATQQKSEAEANLANMQRMLKSALAEIQDERAAARYASSARALQGSITSKQELLADAHRLEARRRKVLDDIEHFKQTGSRATQEAQKEYDDTVKYLRRLRKLIAKLELVLQDTSEDDIEALEAAKEKYDGLVKQLDEYKDFTDELAAFQKKREG